MSSGRLRRGVDRGRSGDGPRSRRYGHGRLRSRSDRRPPRGPARGAGRRTARRAARRRGALFRHLRHHGDDRHLAGLGSLGRLVGLRVGLGTGCLRGRRGRHASLQARGQRSRTGTGAEHDNGTGNTSKATGRGCTSHTPTLARGPQGRCLRKVKPMSSDPIPILDAHFDQRSRDSRHSRRCHSRRAS